MLCLSCALLVERTLVRLLELTLVLVRGLVRLMRFRTMVRTLVNVMMRLVCLPLIGDWIRLR